MADEIEPVEPEEIEEQDPEELPDREMMSPIDPIKVPGNLSPPVLDADA